MKSIYLEDMRNLVRLFQYNVDFDVQSYSVTSHALFIDKTHGRLIVLYIVNRDGGTLRPGASSEFTYECTYEERKEILSKWEIDDHAKFESLNELLFSVDKYPYLVAHIF